MRSVQPSPTLHKRQIANLCMHFRNAARAPSRADLAAAKALRYDSPMALDSRVAPGLTGSVELVVAAEHTASHVGSGRVPVLATLVVINLLGVAVLAGVGHLLPVGYQSLGTELDVCHF